MKTHNMAILSRTVALAGLGLSLSSIQPVKGAGFVSVSPMKSGRHSHTATLLPNGKVLVAGGYGVATSAEFYDPATDTWTRTGSLRAPRADHQATLLPSGKVLIAGSLPNQFRTTSAELYDPATGTWALTGRMKQARSGSEATLLPNGKVLVVGGTMDGMASTELYDPASGTWTATGSWSGGYLATTLLPNGTVLVGYAIYNPVTGTWASTAAPSIEYTKATLLLNGKVLAAASGLGLAELYDPDSGTWSATSSLTWKRAYCTATLLRNGQVLMAGGFEQDTPIIGAPSAELYDPGTGTWTEIPMTERYGHTATLLPNGKVLLAGGSDSSFNLPNLSSADLYEPDEPVLNLLRKADGTVSLSWTGTGALESTESLIPPNWQTAADQTNPQNVSNTGSMKFFRVKGEQP